MPPLNGVARRFSAQVARRRPRSAAGSGDKAVANVSARAGRGDSLAAAPTLRPPDDLGLHATVEVPGHAGLEPCRDSDPSTFTAGPQTGSIASEAFCAQSFAPHERLSSWASRWRGFSAEFLGCKVSPHRRAGALVSGWSRRPRERTRRRGDIAVHQHLLRHQRGALAKCHRRRRGRRGRTRRVYVTGCAASSRGASPGCPRTSSSCRGGGTAGGGFAGDVGAIGCVQPTPARPRPRVREDPGRLLVLVPLLRDPARARRDAQPQRRAVLAEIRRRVARAIARSSSRASTWAAFATGSTGTTLARARGEAGALPGVERLRLSLDRDQPRRRRARRRAARDAGRHGTCTCRCSPGTMESSARWVAATPSRPTSAGSSRSATSTSPSDVIVGFPAEDDAAFERTLETVRRRADQGPRLPYSPRPGTRTAADDTVLLR